MGEGAAGDSEQMSLELGIAVVLLGIYAFVNAMLIFKAIEDAKAKIIKAIKDQKK